MDYRNRDDGEHTGPARPRTGPRTGDDEFQAGERPAAAGFQVPGQRVRPDDAALARPYVSAAEPERAETAATAGRHRQPPAGDDARSTGPDTRPGTGDQWWPTLDPDDWRYATGDIEYPYGSAKWEDDRHGPGWEPVGPRDRYGNADPGSRQREPGRDLGHPPGASAGDAEKGARRAGRHRVKGGRWDETADTEQWNRPAYAADWDGSAGLRPWDRSGDTATWDRLDTGEWPGEPAGTPADGADPGRQPRRPERADDFWSGIRLAGDDPRWMATPTSAPRSPAISIPDQEALADPAGITEPSRRGNSTDDSEPIEGEAGGMVAGLLCTVAWYVVPALLLLAWVLTLDGGRAQDCVITAAQRCESARSHAAAAIFAAWPRTAVALGVSLLIAVLLRWATGWRAAAVGLAAAVIGGGLSTLLISVISGQPLN